MSNNNAGKDDIDITMFDSIEIQPAQHNFGTITKRNCPSVVDLSRGDLSKSNLKQLFEHEKSGSIDTQSMLEDVELKENDAAIKDAGHKKHSKYCSFFTDFCSKEPKKFGTFDGVFARCLLCIWGVIMYLRTGWIVGNSGIWQTTIIMVLASSVTFLTSLSLSAICTNGQVKSGGYYFIISRSLGPEFGGVIGILFAFANCISVAMYLTGFSETITSLYSNSFISETWDIVLWAEVVLTLLLLLAFRGVGGIIKFDMVLLVVLVISIIVFFIGTFGVTPVDPAGIGYTGYSSVTFSENWNADYEGDEDFISVFSVFFPAVTGEMAGANISGDLRNASKAIPNGTLSAIIVSTIVYIGIAWVLGATVLRRVGDSTTKGLLFDYLIMAKIAAWEPLVILGIFASTLSSGMSCFVGAPRIFMAVCQDNLFPQLRYFAKARESDGEPVRSYLVAYVISFAAILTGNINFIAPIITNFFLITYALMNFSCFAWATTKSPGWRPTFRWYNKWVSLFASIECIILMFLIDWLMALITIIIGLLMYKYVSYTDPTVEWGTASEALIYMETRNKLLKYQLMHSNAKNERPMFLIFNQSPAHLKYMYGFANVMNEKCGGLTMIGDIIVGDRKDHYITNKYVKRARSHQWIDIPIDIIKNSLIQTCIAPSFVDGLSIIIQTAGLGAFKPNVALFNMTDFSNVNQIEIIPLKSDNKDKSPQSIATTSSKQQTTPIDGIDNNDNDNSDNNDTNDNKDNNDNINDNDNEDIVNNKFVAPDWIDGIQDALLTGLGVVLIPGQYDIDWNREYSGYIDIWWLYDDGGLTVLIPHLLKSHKLFKKCTLRIMALENLGMQDQHELVKLMDKLRIKAEVNTVKTDMVTFEKIYIKDNSKSTDADAGDYVKTPQDDRLADFPLVDANGSDDSNNNNKQEEEEDDDDDDDDDDNVVYDTLFVGSKLKKSSFIDKRNKSLKHEIFTYDHIDDLTNDINNNKIKDIQQKEKQKFKVLQQKKEDMEYNNIKNDNLLSKYAKKKLKKYCKLGKLIKQSKNSDLCIVTMPFPRAEYSPYEYMKIIQSLTPKNMDNMLFIRGNQDQVLTFAL